LHQHHYKRNDVSAYRARIEGKLPELRMIILTEPWCGDSLAIVPTLLKLFEGFENVEIRFVPRDENKDLMQHYLTRGGEAIPVFIVIDEDFNELFHWGPRPEKVQAIFEEHRADIAAGRIAKADVHKKIRAFYARDRGKTILEEFTGKLLKAV
jgi:thiol-disulfide isomerase/thioredoxin